MFGVFHTFTDRIDVCGSQLEVFSPYRAPPISIEVLGCFERGTFWDDDLAMPTSAQENSDIAHATLPDPLVALLIERGLISEDALPRLVNVVAQSQTPMSAALTRLGVVSERELAESYASLLKIPIAQHCDLSSTPMARDLNPLFLRAKRVLPFGANADFVDLAMADPCDDDAVRAVAFSYGRPVRKFAALETDIEDALNVLESGSSRTTDQLPELGNVAAAEQDDLALLTDHVSDAPVIRMVNRWVAKAVELSASDIHIEPGAQSLAVRFRVDGRLHEYEMLPQRWADPIASRIKLMAKLDIAEKRLPQDGRIKASVRGNAIDLRIATLPGLHGESVVLRILGRLAVELDLDKLALSTDGRHRLRAALSKPHGIILLTGPTGSGKTTTLYAALNALRSPEVKIVTVEDPIEYTMAGVSQLQVKPEIGLSYAAALRAILRNDPDVIMIGEIRDKETADIAVRAALTGHLVLATLHTNTAAGAITRLLDLGVDDFLLASTLIFSGAQRLVRKLCLSCASKRPPCASERAVLAQGSSIAHVPTSLLLPVGCGTCLGRGYLGRTPLFEAITITAELSGRLRAPFDERAFLLAARAEGSVNLFAHGLEKVRDGLTTLDEVLHVAGSEDVCANST